MKEHSLLAGGGVLLAASALVLIVGTADGATAETIPALVDAVRAQHRATVASRALEDASIIVGVIGLGIGLGLGITTGTVVAYATREE